MSKNVLRYLTVGALVLVASPSMAAEQEFYELRIYRNSDAARQAAVVNYLDGALVPALNRMGVKTVGVFVPTGGKPEVPLTDVYVLIPFSDLTQFAASGGILAADEAYTAAASDFMAAEKKDPAYIRLESRLMRAFAGMPVLEVPGSDSEERLLELRIYESHNTQKARRKVEMFNDGEIEVMKEVKLGPVFFGETLISNDVPNLTYMLSAPSEEAHGEHWGGFGKHPRWQVLKKMEKYKGTVSSIRSIKLKPAACSQI
ncbi:MAG: NIPSNAP family containing protein [Fuerstiella sp.]|nr:NIPSNAP family containing protein [Fuerstiella sp.]MCP4859245.1 NIPSNAP family containing protein [Fuerstiella sp.]